MMIKEIVSELTSGLLNNRIQLNELLETIGVEQPLKSTLNNQFTLGLKGNNDELNQFKLTLSSFFQKTRQLDNEESTEGSEFKEDVVELAIELNIDEMLEHVTSHASSSLASHIPIIAIASYGHSQYNYQKNISELTSGMQSLIQDVENDCKTTHALYQIISRDFQIRLNETTDPAARVKIMDEWQKYHDYFSDRIKMSQQNISILGAKIQELNSQARFKNVRFALDLTSAGLHLMGPVGSALSSVVAGANVVIGGSAVSYTSNSANYNHMVLPEEEIHITHTSDNDLLNGLDRIRHIENAELTFNTPELTNNGRKIQTNDIPHDKFGIERFADDLSKKLAKETPPYIALNLPPFEFNRTASSSLAPDASPLLIHLDKLLTEQKELQRAYMWYNGLTKSMLQRFPKDKCPILSNLDQIEHELKEKAKAIDLQMAQLQPLLASSANQKDIVQKAGLIRAYQPLTQAEAITLHEQAELIKHSDYYKFANPSASQTIDPHDPDYSDYAAWQKDNMQFQLDAMRKMLNACDKMGEGRQLANMPQLLKQLQTQMQSITPSLNENEKLSFDEKIKDCVRWSLAIDEARIQELTQLHKTNPGLFGVTEFRRAMLDMQKKLSAYPVHDMQIPRLIDRVNSTLSQLDQTKAIGALSEISSVNASQISQQHTLMITPSRLEFGLNKREDQIASVNATVDQLMKQNMNVKNIQILPLQPLNHEVWVATRGDEKKLADAIEGLKTEIQWVNQFCSESVQKRLQTTVDTKITISNIQAVRENYAAQIQFIRQQLKQRNENLTHNADNTFAAHHSSTLGNVFARMGSILTNTLRPSKLGKVVLQNSETELAKCEQALAKLDQFIAQESRKQPINAATTNMTVQAMHPDIHLIPPNNTVASSPQPREHVIERVLPLEVIEAKRVAEEVLPEANNNEVVDVESEKHFIDLKKKLTEIEHPEKSNTQEDNKNEEESLE